MKKLLVMSICMFSSFMILANCSNHNSSVLLASENPSDNSNTIRNEENLMYKRTINKFKHAVKDNDAEALYDLIDLNFERDVYWTVKEAQDLIDYLMSEPFLLEKQLYLLEKNIEQINLLDELNAYDPNNEEKRIPLAYSQDGLVFLQPDGKLTIKVLRHKVIVNEKTLGDFDEIILNYEEADKQFVLNDSFLKNHQFKSESNSEVVMLMHAGPGNYTFKAKKYYDGEVEGYKETFTLSDYEFTRNQKGKNKKEILMRFN